MTTRRVPLMRFIPRVSPKFTAPMHLAPFVELLQRTDVEEVLAVVDTPPRHYKTETVKHAIARRLLSRPETRIGYATYSAALAGKKAREIRDLYRRAGGRVDDGASARTDWRTGSGDGGLWAGGVGGSWTGEGFDLLVIDDPVKDRAIAESALERDKLWAWFTDVAYTRLEPGGSCIVNGTRWHHDDLSGRLISDGWQRVHLPAIDERGRALCPDRFSITKLRQIQEQLGDYGWASLYMGEPYPRGGAVFRDAYYYDVEPVGRLKIRIGIDLAYSTKSRADYSVAVVLAELGGSFFILDVIRVQLTAPDFVRRLAALQARYGGAKLCGFFGGTERGTLDMARRELGLSIDERPATTDKFTRCQPVAAAWNAGKVLLPRHAPWLDAFVSEIVSFTGVGDRHDDQVDALAGAYSAVSREARREARRAEHAGHLSWTGLGECAPDGRTAGQRFEDRRLDGTDGGATSAQSLAAAHYSSTASPEIARDGMARGAAVAAVVNPSAPLGPQYENLNAQFAGWATAQALQR